MKRLIVCCDGTWDRWGRAQPTNVVKMARAIALNGKEKASAQVVPQVVFYHEGVGTGNLVDRIRGGLFGYGLDLNVEESYRFLVNNYEPGDEIYLFGFSRGAYTARSTAGLIRKCGLLKKTDGDKIGEALGFYRLRDASADGVEACNFRVRYSHPEPLPPSDERYSHVVRVHFIGVWDTVGSLGVPLRSLSWVPWNNKYKFHDTRLSSSVKNAFHAVSIDERRGSFAPTLWDEVPAPGQRAEQVWFAGVHSEVGGGSSESGLSNLALDWMIDRARECGLAFDKEQVGQIKATANPRESVDNSLSGFWRYLAPYTRPMGLTKPGAAGPPNSESMHPSVCVKLNTESSSYHPKNVLEYLKRSDRRLATAGPEHWNKSPSNQCPKG